MLPWTLSLAVAVVAVATAGAVPAPAPGPALAPSSPFLLKLDISPEEAAQYLASPPFSSPALAPRVETRPLVRWDSPQFRAADAGPTRGHYWRDGHEIQNTDDYVEDVYNAAQFHGQDGLGAYKYGYSAPESAKVEDRERSGRVQGAYTYVGGAGGPPQIEVRYWADHDGFHQEDNLPKVKLEPAQETEEVRRARLEHERAWHQAADAALHPNAQNQYASAASAPQASYATTGYGTPGIGVETAREAKAFNNQQYQQQAGAKTGYAQQYQQQAPTQSGAHTGNAQQYQPQAPTQGGDNADYPYQYQQQASTQVEARTYYGQQQPTPGPEAEPEPTGPPRGFFYSFNYPVSIVVPKNEAAAEGERAHG